MEDAGKPLLDTAGEEGERKQTSPPTPRRTIHHMLEGKTLLGRLFLAFSFSATFFSFVIFALDTEPVPLINDSTHALLLKVDSLLVIFFTVEYFLRFWAHVEFHPDVASLSSGELTKYRFGWASTNVFAVVDIVSVLPFWLDKGPLAVVWQIPDNLQNLQWIRLIRILRVLPKLPWGEVWTKSSPLLFAGGFAGVTVWIICASLYYTFEHENELMDYSPAGDDAGPNDPHWNNFHSIPAAMYFSLLNFFGEFPLIDQHSTGGRFVAMFIQVIGAAVMAIPAGALGNAFSDIIGDEIPDDDDDGDGDGDAPAPEDAAEPGSQKTKWERCLDGENDVMDLPFTEFLGGIDAGYFMSTTIISLSLCSVAHFVLSSLTKFPGNLIQTLDFLYVFNDIASIVLLLEWLYRLKASLNGGVSGLKDYIFSTPGVVDFMGVWPWFIWLRPSSSWIMATHVLRILKLERFIGAFKLFYEIISKKAAAFAATFTLAMVMWFLFSTLMYYAERSNPDPDMQRYYSSVFTAMWMTLLNLSGEAPLCEYTVAGKVITAFMGLFGVGFVSIPMGLLGDSFNDEVEDLDDDGDDDKEGDDEGILADPDAAAQESALSGSRAIMSDPENLTKRQKVFKFLQGSAGNQLEDMNPWEGVAVRFEQFVIFMIFASAVVAVMEESGESGADSWYQDLFEAFVVILFTIEYALRYYSTPENPYWSEAGYVTDSACRFAFMSSWPSVIDVLAIGPFYIALCGSDLADKYDGQLRMLRVFRLLTLDKYIPSVSLISRVLKNKASQFKMAGYAMISLCLIFSTLLWLTERDDKFKIDDLRQSQRYHSVISAFPYTLVHLTGDYPLVDYTLDAKIVLFFALFFGVGVVAVPAGLLASGFQDALQEKRDEERAKQAAAQSKIEKLIKGWIARRRMRKLIEQAVAADKDQKEKESKRDTKSSRFKMHLFLDGLTTPGKLWSRFMMLLIVLNVLAVILETCHWIQHATGQQFWDIFEFFSVAIFTFMYAMHIWVAPDDGNCNYSRWEYIKSFWGIVDLITIAPYWCQQAMEVLNLDRDFAKHAFIFRIFRILRILQAEDYIESFTLLDDAWFQCRDSMIACGFMAMMVWVCGSILFHNFEAGNPRMDGAFDTLLGSMYYSLIFLGGEWGLIDFTPLGQVVCVFYASCGIALYGIPVGALFEAFGSVLEDRNSAGDGEDGDDDDKKKAGDDDKKGGDDDKKKTPPAAKPPAPKPPAIRPAASTTKPAEKPPTASSGQMQRLAKLEKTFEDLQSRASTLENQMLSKRD